MHPKSTPKLCECGCGQPAPIAKKTRTKLGHVRGEPVRFIQGHSGSLPKPNRAIPPFVRLRPIEIREDGVAATTLSSGETVLFDVEDLPLIERHNWQNNGAGYAQCHRSRSKGTMLMHRMIMNSSAKETVDHINGDTLDNRRCNLRIATHAQNIANTGIRRTNTSGYKGVSRGWGGKQWRATIHAGGEWKHIGTFATAEEAARAYDEVARDRHGDFAKLNFPDD